MATHPLSRKPGFPTLDHVWLGAVLVLVVLRVLVNPIQPHDFWWQMATGRLIMATGMVPTVDAFSYTQAGSPFFNQPWLAQWLLFQLHALGGLPLLILVHAAVLLLANGLLLWLAMVRSAAPRLSAGLLLLAFPVLQDNWGMRPQTAVYALFVGVLALLMLWREAVRGPQPYGPPRWWWLAPLPLLLALWTNMHGSFVLGGLLVALTFASLLVGRLWQARQTGTRPDLAPLLPLVGWGALAALATLLNPRGLGVYSYVFNLVGAAEVRAQALEWQPPWFVPPGGTFSPINGIFFALLLGCALLLWRTRRAANGHDLLLVLPLLALAFEAVRNMIWLAMVLVPVVSAQVAAWQRARRGTQVRRVFQGSPLLNGLVLGVLLLGLVPVLPWVKPALDLPPAMRGLVSLDTPVAAVEALQADPQPPARLFHAQRYGSYLIWAAPQQPVFIDPRLELYPLAQWQDYFALGRGTDVPALLARYQIDGLLLHNDEQAGLLALVEADPATWQIRYQDDQSTYAVRR